MLVGPTRTVFSRASYINATINRLVDFTHAHVVVVRPSVLSVPVVVAKRLNIYTRTHIVNLVAALPLCIVRLDRVKLRVCNFSRIGCTEVEQASGRAGP